MLWRAKGKLLTRVNKQLILWQRRAYTVWVKERRVIGQSKKPNSINSLRRMTKVWNQLYRSIWTQPSSVREGVQSKTMCSVKFINHLAKVDQKRKWKFKKQRRLASGTNSREKSWICKRRPYSIRHGWFIKRWRMFNHHLMLTPLRSFNIFRSKIKWLRPKFSWKSTGTNGFQETKMRP